MIDSHDVSVKFEGKLTGLPAKNTFESIRVDNIVHRRIQLFWGDSLTLSNTVYDSFTR